VKHNRRVFIFAFLSILDRSHSIIRTKVRFGGSDMRNAICAAEMPVTLGGQTKQALEWAIERGLKWQTVKMRRYRGDTWNEALRPNLRPRTWMKGWTMNPARSE
jgi:hypothetical protein